MEIGGVKCRATSAQSPVTVSVTPARPRSDVGGVGRSTCDANDLGASFFVEKQAAITNDFTIPELPQALSLEFVLLSPWDDPFYIGLEAIEIFTENGTRPEIESIKTDARESFGDVRSLLQCRAWPTSDPRAMWMCKYRSCSQEPSDYGSASTQLPITVTVRLKYSATIAMIRIWNYSESRVHAPRGVCRMRIDVDDRRECIFRGEISCAFTNSAANGVTDEANDAPDQRPMGDTILFTTNEEILSRIAENDTFIDENYAAAAVVSLASKSTCKTRGDRRLGSGDSKRRGTSAENFERTSSALNALQLRDCDVGTLQLQKPTAAFIETPNFDAYERVAPQAAVFNINALVDIKRPTTGSQQCFAISPSPAAVVSKRNATDAFSFDDIALTAKKRVECVSDENANPKATSLNTNDDDDDDGDDDDEVNDNIVDEDNRSEGICGKVFHMELLANWGASDLIGLTGIQFLGPHSEALAVDGCVVRYSDHDDVTSACVTGSTVDDVANNTNLLRLLNGNNLTCSVDEMWLHDWKSENIDTSAVPSTISFSFSEEVCLGGISLWNYNASSELSYCGVKCVQFYVNGRPIYGPVLLRRAPGSVYFDYVQDILFDRCHLFRPLTSRPTTKSISAFLFELRLLSSWGDEYYIGLNGVELYNRKNQLMRLKPQNLAAFPESVNVLPSMHGDPRSSDKLIDNINDTKKPHNMWLTPLLPNNYARIFFIFDAPEFVSRIRIYNYRKTPQRGVRHIAITADDLIIYSGEVPQSNANETGVLDLSLRDLD